MEGRSRELFVRPEDGKGYGVVLNDPGTCRVKVRELFDMVAVAYLEPKTCDLEPQDALWLVDLGFRLPGVQSPHRGAPNLSWAKFAVFKLWQTDGETEQSEELGCLLESSSDRIGERVSSLRSEVAAREKNLRAVRLLREDPSAQFEPVSAPEGVYHLVPSRA